MGLPQIHRLRHHKDFQQVYKQGKTYKSSHFVLKVLAVSLKEDHPASRFGITISRKVSKQAVTRNRLKRQIRAVIRTLLPQITASWKMVIIVRRQSLECNYEHFLRELKQLFIQAEIIHGHSRRNLL